jgi:glucokinase
VVKRLLGVEMGVDEPRRALIVEDSIETEGSAGTPRAGAVARDRRGGPDHPGTPQDELACRAGCLTEILHDAHAFGHGEIVPGAAG